MAKKRKPTHPGAILREHYVSPLAITITAFAEAIGVSRKTLSKILNEEARITPDMAVRLSKALKTSPELWLNLQQKYDLWEAENNKALCSENIRPLPALVALAR